MVAEFGELVRYESDEIAGCLPLSRLWANRRSFASRDDFNGSDILSEFRMLTPKRQLSLSTANGNPDHGRVKNNLPITVNDSISSN